jgi:hypothetical protein
MGPSRCELSFRSVLELIRVGCFGTGHRFFFAARKGELIYMHPTICVCQLHKFVKQVPPNFLCQMKCSILGGYCRLKTV